MSRPNVFHARSRQIKIHRGEDSPGQSPQSTLDCLPGTTDVQLKALSEILGPLVNDSKDKKHCVRCHATFTENNNHPSACKIKHSDYGDGDRYEAGSETLRITLPCCGIEYLSEDGEGPNVYCYTSTHTTDPSEVMYYDDNGDDGEECGNENVVTCQEKGCTTQKRKSAGGKSSAPNKKRYKTFHPVLPVDS